MQTNRNLSVDFFRFFAAFAVISIHVEYGELSRDIQSFIRLFGRWAGPFFFSISGYYFQIRYQSKGDIVLLKTLKEMSTVFIIADILFLPVAILRDGHSSTEMFTFASICSGTYFHLWFIGSMILGYLVVWLGVSNKKYVLLSIVSVVVLFLLVASDSYSFLGIHLFDTDLSRFLMAIPFLFIGFLFSKYRVEERVSMALCYFLIATGLVMELTEAGLIHKITGYDMWEIQFLFGTYIYGLGVTLLSLKLLIKKDNLISFIGRKYTLHLFLYHPFLNICIFFVLKHIGILNYIIWLSPIIAIIFNVIFWSVVERYFPRMFYFFGGKFNVEVDQNRESATMLTSFFKKADCVYYVEKETPGKIA